MSIKIDNWQFLMNVEVFIIDILSVNWINSSNMRHENNTAHNWKLFQIMWAT